MWMIISLDVVSVSVTHPGGIATLPNTPTQSPLTSPIVFLPQISWLWRWDMLSYVILLKHKVSSVQTVNKLLLPRQWRCSHFHKHRHYSSSFLNLLSVCACFIWYANSNQFNFFLQKAIKEPRELSLNHRLIQHKKKKSYLHPNERNHKNVSILLHPNVDPPFNKHSSMSQVSLSSQICTMGRHRLWWNIKKRRLSEHSAQGLAQSRYTIHVPFLPTSSITPSSERSCHMQSYGP